MIQSSLEIVEEEFKQIADVTDRLLRETSAKVIFLVDKDGQIISETGDTENIDTTSLASLTAGNIAATGGLAKLIGEKEFSILFHEGEKDNIHISIVGQRLILVIIFNKKTSLGLVRLRVKKASEELGVIVKRLLAKGETNDDLKEKLLVEITDDDIDSLFG